jgi:hypothetical protein
VEADATVFVITNLTEFLSDFANVDIGKTLEVEGQLLLGQGLDMPLPGATLGSNGMIRLDQFATATVDADALFQGTGEIQLFGANIVVTNDATFQVDLIPKEEKNEIRSLPLVSGQQIIRLKSYAEVEEGATLELGITTDIVLLERIFAAKGQLVLRAAETQILGDFGTLVAASPAGRVTMEQDGTTPVVSLTNHNQIFVQTGGTLEVTGTLGGYSPGDVLFINSPGAFLGIQSGGVVTTKNPPVADVPRIINFGRIVLGGEIRGNLQNAGTIYPGASPGLGIVGGTLELNEFSRIVIDIDGTMPETEYDRLLVDATAELDGLLEINFGNDFTPAPGDGFEFLDAGSVTGTFAQVTGANGLPVTYEANRVYLGENPDEFDTSSWPRPVIGAEVREAETSFCIDDEGFHFDIIFGMAETYDLIILALASDTASTFSNPSESVRLNYYTVEEVFDPRLPDPIVQITSGYVGADRLLDGIITDGQIEDIQNGFFRFQGTVADGTEPFSGGDLIESPALRASQYPLVPEDDVDYDSRTNVYTSGSRPDMLTVNERVVCAVPEPGSTLLSLSALATLLGVQGLRRRLA